MSGLKRLLSGSNSKYVMENASCNVFVIKSALRTGEGDEHSRADEEGLVSHATKEEEEKYYRRMRERLDETVDDMRQKALDEEEKKVYQKIADLAADVEKKAKSHEDLSTHISLLADENLRLRAIQSTKDEIAREHHERGIEQEKGRDHTAFPGSACCYSTSTTTSKPSTTTKYVDKEEDDIERKGNSEFHVSDEEFLNKLENLNVSSHGVPR